VIVTKKGNLDLHNSRPLLTHVHTHTNHAVLKKRFVCKEYKCGCVVYISV